MLFASIVAIVSLFLTSDRKNSRCNGIDISSFSDNKISCIGFHPHDAQRDLYIISPAPILAIVLKMSVEEIDIAQKRQARIVSLLKDIVS